MEAASRPTVRPHYSRLFEAAGLGLVMTDARGMVLHVSPMAAKLLQRPIESLYGKSFEALFGHVLPPLANEQEFHQRLYHQRKTYDLTFIRFNTQIEISFSLVGGTLVNGTPMPIPQVDYPDNPDELLSLLVESQWHETLYSVLANHLPDIGVVMFDTDYRYLLAEGQALEHAGFHRAMMEGRTIDEALTPELRAGLKPIYRATLEGESLQQDYVYHERTYHLTTIPIRHNDGTVIAGMVVIHDITRFRAIEAQLRASKDHLTTLVKAIPDVMFVVDQYERITEFHSDEFDDLVRMLFPTLKLHTTLQESGFPEIFYDKFSQGIQEAFEKQSRRIFRLETTTLQGTELFLSAEVTIVPLHTETMLVIIRDMSEQAWAQDLLMRLMDRLRSLDDIENTLARSNPNIHETLVMALHSAVTFTDAEAGFIAMLDEQGEWQPAHVKAATYNLEAVNDYLRQRCDPIPYILESGQSLILSRGGVLTDAPFLEGMTAQVFVPLKLNDRVIGILVMEAPQAGAFDGESVSFIELTMSRYTSALENARLRMNAERQFEELSDLYERVSKLEELKTDMIRVASHDLRTPMMLIVNYVNLAREGLAKSALSEVHEYLDSIRAATERMRQMTGEILSLERLQSLVNDETPNIESTDALAQTAFQDNTHSAKLKSQEYTLFIADEPMFAAIDPVQIREAMSNLISNAIKYTPNGGKISVNLRTDDDKIVFTVTDTGYGIPKEALDKLFQPFYRVPQTRRIAEGTGLGLSLVKSIIERHKGQLFVESEQGKGSTFGFTLPRRPHA